MDILYIVGTESRCYDFELKCSLQALEEHGQGVDRVFVVGHCPDWLSDEVIKLPCEDLNQGSNITPLKKAQNIAKKVLYAIDNSDISEEFIVSMDDHYYVRDTDFVSYPYYVKLVRQDGLLPQEHTGKTYNDFLADCSGYLKSLLLPTFYFTLHRNMHISRTAVNECRDIINDCIENDRPFEIFILINNYRFKEGEIMPTFVTDNRINGGLEWWKSSSDVDECFSTADFSMGLGLYILMKSKYTGKSKYVNEEENNSSESES